MVSEYRFFSYSESFLLILIERKKKYDNKSQRYCEYTEYFDRNRF